MKKLNILFAIISVFYLTNSNSQITYDAGYYINNADEKVNCFIKNIDWKNNPTEFDYKLTEASEKKTLTISSVKEFGINAISKYVRATVNIDRSSNKKNNLSTERKPLFNEEQIFLKVLIEGNAHLYAYEDKSVTRYFYQKSDNTKIEQLIFKKYKIQQNKINTNNTFRNQLNSDLKCNSIVESDLKNLNYNKKELLRFFTKYNSCTNGEIENFEEKSKSDLFNLNIRPGISNASLSIANDFSNFRNTDYDNKLNFRLGLELEFVMPFNRNKWAVIIEPTYQYYKADKVIPNQINTAVDYQSIELPIGIRHYLFLNKSSKFFVNGAFIYDFDLDSNVRTLDVSSRLNVAIGLGYNYNNKYSIEFRYHTNRDLLADYIAWRSEYKTMSLIFGYSIF
ncbi:MAG: tRNA modification GTPase [Winogradskyella sp.]|uniref:tRNA modification GTPase n=1 Tax=Winogradskyella sp. TaxID=1883156 RepID=UPI00385ED12F